MKQTTALEKELWARYTKLPAALAVSWFEFLHTAYDVASEKKQYHRASEILSLISDEINADSEYYEHCQID